MNPCDASLKAIFCHLYFSVAKKTKNSENALLFFYKQTAFKNLFMVEQKCPGSSKKQ